MENKIKLFRDNKFVFIPISEWFEEQYKELPLESKRYYEVISDIFRIKDLDDYKRIYAFLWVDFNYHRIMIKYEELKQKHLPFDDDIIKFIAFLFGTAYFGLIGYTTLEDWLNAKDLNYPQKKGLTDNEGYSMFDAVNYKYGQNAIREKLLTTLHWISAQSGT